MRTNHFKSVTRGGGTALGVALTIADPLVAEMVGAGAPDFLMIDAEHAPLSSSDLQTMLVALRTARATSLVRVAANDPALIGMALDLGAEGVIVPAVVSGESCHRAVAAARYAGTRGLGPRRAARLDGGRVEYLARADEEIAVVVMIESRDALEHLDDILATPGLDAVMVGPADLAVSLGHLTEPGHADVQGAIESIHAACGRHGVPFGIFAAAEAAARKWADRQAAFIVIGADLQYLDQGLARARALAEELRA
ncbi:aldolase/citrate lyase family protein [Dactylosporangium sp. NPDC051485]|uniref:HpcH/HpaI aldolase family protein n=1 Tax=Dactylosporangium sp. NPDC051485 TaxID=3154846 RepID=UPI003435C164